MSKTSALRSVVALLFAAMAIVVFPSSEAPYFGATKDTPVEKFTLAQALQRDVGMSPQKFWGSKFVSPAEGDARSAQDRVVMVTYDMAGRSFDKEVEQYPAGVTVTIARDESRSICTAAFRVLVDGKSMLMSAKHCYPPAGKPGEKLPSAAVKTQDRSESAVTSGEGTIWHPHIDGALLPFDFESNSGLQNRFYSNQLEPKAGHSNDSYGEANVAVQPRQGEVVCSYGVTSGYRCGKVLGSDESLVYTDFCSRGGDSGGPVFSARGMIGVLSVSIGPAGSDRMACYNGRRSNGMTGSGVVAATDILNYAQSQGHVVSFINR